jgi:putative endonuclease
MRSTHCRQPSQISFRKCKSRRTAPDGGQFPVCLAPMLDHSVGLRYSRFPFGARSSAGEHSLHTGGVTGSIPVAPTTLRPSGYAWRSHKEPEGRSVSGVAGVKRKRRRTGWTMWYVYIIRSRSSPTEEYTGATANLKQRLMDHNAGKSGHTVKYRPWRLAWYCAFPDKFRALELERYLKSHSGRAFAHKRLL